MYEVILERSAERDLRRLSADDFRRAVAALKGLKENPRPPGCRKLEGSKRDWRIRMRVYRLLYEVDDTARIVRVFRIRHRREAYRE